MVLVGLAFSWQASARDGLEPVAVSETGVSADEWAQRARDLAARESLAAAEEAFETALAVDPERIDIRLDYAAFLKRWAFFLRGGEQYRLILAKQPGNVAARLDYGELLNAGYHFKAAARQFRKVLDMKAGVHQVEHARVGLGSSLFGLGEYEEAARVWEKLLEEHPNDMSAVAYLAIAHRKMGQFDQALKFWDRLLDVLPGATRALTMRREIEQLRSSIQSARELVEKTPADPMAWVRLADFLREKPDLPGAIEAYEAAVEVDAGNPWLHFQLGLAYRDAGRWRDAVRQFRRVPSNEQFSAMSLYNLAYCAVRAGRMRTAARAWADAVASHPADDYAYRRYIEVLKSTNRLPVEKTRASEQIKQRQRDGGAIADPMLWVRLGIIQRSEGDLEAARRSALEAIRVDMNSLEVRRFARSVFALYPGAVRAALHDLETPVAGSLDAGYLRLRAGLHLVLGDLPAAEKDLRAVIAAGRADAQVMVALGGCLRQAERIQEGIAVLREAARRWPDYAPARYGLALAWLEQGRPAEALLEAKQATALEADSTVGYSLAGTALRRQGDLAGATRALERAVSVRPAGFLAAPRFSLVRLYAARGMFDRGHRALVGDLPQEPYEMYRMVWEFVRDIYYDRTFHGQDWKTWENRFEGRLETPTDALGAISLMLSSLDDRNTRMRAVQQNVILLLTPRSPQEQFTGEGQTRITSKTVEHRRLSDNVGYIAVTNLDDPQAEKDIHKAAEDLASADGLILDLRGNQGGNADTAQISGVFLNPETPLGKIVGQKAQTIQKATPPAGREGPVIAEDKPMVVLVDRNTASSAEILAGSLRESRNAVVIGEKTFGKSGVQMTLLLPGGTIVLVEGAEHENRSGQMYTGHGLQPDVAVDAPMRVNEEQGDRVIDKAREVIKKRKGGS
ncbi:MAG: S41 family peptidase [Acidobacteriota bacterium]